MVFRRYFFMSFIEIKIREPLQCEVFSASLFVACTDWTVWSGIGLICSVELIDIFDFEAQH